MICSFCDEPLAYLHGHAACVNQSCPIRGANQSECCSGEEGPTTDRVLTTTPIRITVIPPTERNPEE